jgi:hypothetical protein
MKRGLDEENIKENMNSFSLFFFFFFFFLKKFFKNFFLFLIHENIFYAGICGCTR